MPAYLTAVLRAGRGASSVAFFGLLWARQGRALPAWLELVGLALYLAACTSAVRRRRRLPVQAGRAASDFELGSLAAAAALLLTLSLPGGLRGSFSGVMYVFLILMASHAQPRALAAVWLLLSAFQLASAGPASVRAGLAAAALPQVLSLGASAAAVWLVRQRLREGGREGRRSAELPRSPTRASVAPRPPRRLADSRAAELRALDLRPAQPRAPEPRSAELRTAELRTAELRTAELRTAELRTAEPRTAELRTAELRTAELRTEGAARDSARAPDGVLELQSTLRAALEACQLALGARSVLALSLDTSRRWLFLRDRSTSEALCPGPFGAGDGVFAASLQAERLAELVLAPAARQVSYYKSPLAVGHVAALPLRGLSGIEGLLALDRERCAPLDEREREILERTAVLVQSTLETERIVVQLERTKAEQGKLYRAAEQLNEAKSELQVIEAGVGSAREFAAFHFAAVTLVRANGEHEICAVSGASFEALVGKSFGDNTGLVGMVVQNRHPLPYRGSCEAGRQVLFTRSLPSPDMRSLLVLPLLVHQDVLGTLVLGSDEVGAFGSSVRPTLEVLARHIAVSLANARMMKRLEDLATTDGLTGLLNKRALFDVARQKLRSAARFRKPLSVLVCDLDHFKVVNDTHGHDVGDRVIQGFADVLKRSKRDTDVVGRFGGEEFVVVSEQTDLVGARQLAERIRADLERCSFVVPGATLRVTCSVGVAAFPQAGSQWEDLFRATDEALYASKHAGRNRVTVWAPRHAKVG